MSAVPSVTVGCGPAMNVFTVAFQVPLHSLSYSWFGPAAPIFIISSIAAFCWAAASAGALAAGVALAAEASVGVPFAGLAGESLGVVLLAAQARAAMSIRPNAAGITKRVMRTWTGDMEVPPWRRHGDSTRRDTGGGAAGQNGGTLARPCAAGERKRYDPGSASGVGGLHHRGLEQPLPAVASGRRGPGPGRDLRLDR